MHHSICDICVLINYVAKLSQASAPAGLSLALFPNYPATQPDPTGKVNFWAIDNFFLVYMEPEMLQQWQTTHFKACSKS